MINILIQIVEYNKKYFDWKLYSAMALLLSAIMWINYSLNLEDDYLHRTSNLLVKGIGMFFFQALPYLAVVFLLYLFGKKKDWISSPGFWIKFILGFSILAIDRTSSVWRLANQLFATENVVFGFRILTNLKSFIVLIPPLALFYLFTERDKPRNFYGLISRDFNPKPFLILLGIASIFIIIGGFFSDIKSFYPMYLKSGGSEFAEIHNLPPWIPMLMYEIPYGIDFISVEMFFRGFLIFAFYRYLGPYVVLPMIATYCVLHFGKPLTESISSVFGGYILGIIALNHKSIWGGVIIHMGIAWLMELVGYLFRITNV
jgi:hypothetical protein